MQLMPSTLEAAATAAALPLRLRVHAGYDHSYFFVASFVGEHVRFAASALRKKHVAEAERAAGTVIPVASAAAEEVPMSTHVSFFVSWSFLLLLSLLLASGFSSDTVGVWLQVSTVGPIECQAMIAFAPNEPLRLETVVVAPPKAGEVRVRVIANALCHTDV
jgi:S-(hydroxymethyl)glutathione dehydrogenase / alcohol dehydrogenase